MNWRSLAPQRPIRMATIAAAAVALWCSFWCLFVDIPLGVCLLFSGCYGGLLAGYVVGVLLAVDHRVTRWWLACFLIVFAILVILAVVVVYFPQKLFEWIWLFKVAGNAINAWLLAGCLLAVYGWWAHFRRPKPAPGSGSVDHVPSRS